MALVQRARDGHRQHGSRPGAGAALHGAGRARLSVCAGSGPEPRRHRPGDSARPDVLGQAAAAHVGPARTAHPPSQGRGLRQGLQDREAAWLPLPYPAGGTVRRRITPEASVTPALSSAGRIRHGHRTPGS